MTSNTPRLPGITRERPKTGRARRGVDASIAARRAAGLLGPADEDLVVAERIAADAVDHELARIRADPDVSAAVLAQALGRLAGIMELQRRLNPEQGPDDDDPIADVFTDLGYTPPT